MQEPAEVPDVRDHQSWPLLPSLFKFFNGFENKIEGLLKVFLDYLTLNDYSKLRNLNSRTRFSKQLFFCHGKMREYLLENGSEMSPYLRYHLYGQRFPSVDALDFHLPLNFKNERLLPIPKMSKKHFDTLNQIHIDLMRTQIPYQPDQKLPDKAVFDCMEILYQICCIEMPEMGYCQGLNFIVSVFYYIANKEKQTCYQMIIGLIKE
jgi:hypothetical protein